jgi:hypothetical protein
LIAGQQAGVLGEEALEQLLGVIGLLVHLHEVAIVLDQENASAHGKVPTNENRPNQH